MTVSRFFLGALALISILGFAPSAWAQIEKYNLDKPHTQIIFAVDHLGFAKSYGKFLDYAGTITYDRGTPQKSSADITIQSASLSMGDDKWDTHLKSAEFLDVQKFPAITFKSTGIKVTGKDTADMTGDLTIHGVTKPVVLAVRQNKLGKHPMMDRMEAGFSATVKIKRSDFGVSYGVPMVGDDLSIIIEVEAYTPDPAKNGTANP